MAEKLPHLTAIQQSELVSRAEVYFLEQTRRKRVPVTALWLWVDLALAADEERGGGAVAEKVSSIKRGDTTIQYETFTPVGMSALYNRINQYKVVVTR